MSTYSPKLLECLAGLEAVQAGVAVEGGAQQLRALATEVHTGHSLARGMRAVEPSDATSSAHAPRLDAPALSPSGQHVRITALE